MYRCGVGVAMDPDRAAELYRAAIAQGHAGAMVNLGLLHHEGLGRPADPVTALMFFDLAADAGLAAAVDIRDRALAALTEAQIAEARRRAQVCRAAGLRGCD